MHFPHGNKRVEISTPHGSGGGVYYVNIDRFYQGQLIKTEAFGWTIALNPKRILSGENVAALLERIETT